MKKIITLYLFFLTSISFGQTINSLDAANGFKEFHFGDPKSKWISQIIKSKAGFENSYNYIGSCCQTAFGEDVSDIILTFDKDDKLVMFFVALKDNQEALGQKQFFNTLKAAFGTPDASDFPVNSSGEATGDMNYQWQGSKVLLSVGFTYVGVEKGGWQISLMYSLESNSINPTKDY